MLCSCEKNDGFHPKMVHTAALRALTKASRRCINYVFSAHTHLRKQVFSMQFSERDSELYAEFSLPGDTAREAAYTLSGWPVRYAEHPTGRYHTLQAGDITALSADDRLRLSRAAAEILSEYLSGAGCVLVCGLGSERLTADRLGPETCCRLTIPDSLPGGRRFYSFSPGTEAATGIPTDTLVGMTAECVRADRILAVDALCARSAASLTSVLQFTDTGLTPGSGASRTTSAGDITKYSRREACPPEISTRTMPCPVVTAGVPTAIRTTLPDGGNTKYLVTAGNIDRAVDCWSSVLASAILRVMLRP